MTHPLTPQPGTVTHFLGVPLVPPEDCSNPADWIADRIYQMGADRELEACCEWLVRNYNYPEAGNPLRATRRPKPPSLKEEALTALHAIATGANDTRELHQDLETILAALEQLDD
jgi:hypothetical protein